MRLSIGMPGETRQDREFTETISREKNLGKGAGKWDKCLYPPDALKPIKELDGQIRRFHDSFTVPFDKGIGILPASLIEDYGERMRGYCDMRDQLVQIHYVQKYDEFVEWAREKHNGTFNPALYPGAQAMLEKFYIKTQPIPVPNSTHFESTVASLLGTDTDSIDQRVRDAEVEGQKEVMRRLIEPIKRVLDTCTKDNPVIRKNSNMLSSIKEISELAPKLNLAGDPDIDAFAAELKQFEMFDLDELKENKGSREEAAKRAAELMKRMEGYAA